MILKHVLVFEQCSCTAAVIDIGMSIIVSVTYLCHSSTVGCRLFRLTVSVSLATLGSVL